MTMKNRFLPDFDLVSSTPRAVDYYGDSKDPRSLTAHFLMAEIGVKLSNIREFSDVTDRMHHASLPKWTWNGNLFCVEIDRITCTVTDFEAGPDDDLISSVSMSHAEFLNVLQEWQRYIAKFPLPTY